jgi:hypothetical protein
MVANHLSEETRGALAAQQRSFGIDQKRPGEAPEKPLLTLEGRFGVVGMLREHVDEHVDPVAGEPARQVIDVQVLDPVQEDAISVRRVGADGLRNPS